MQPSDEKTKTVKEQLQRETEAWNHKPRYGLFSYHANHGFGFRDDPNQTSTRDETGRVKTAPKNFACGRPKSAHVAIDAFTRTGYLSQNDEYIDPSKVMKYRSNNPEKIKQVHGQAFKPSADVPKRIMAPYEFIADPVDPTMAKNSQNSQKNFLTTGPKKGYGNTTYGHLFSQPRYQTDPFDYPKMVDSMERIDHANRIKSGAFFTTFSKRDHFTPNYRLYRDPPGMSKKQARQIHSSSGLRPFLRADPPRDGYNRTINRFPEYIEQKEDPNLNKNTEAEGKWKVPYKERTVPTPSVQTYNALTRPRRKF